MNILSYPKEKLSAAVGSLAESAASIQIRVRYALMALHTLKDDDFQFASNEAKEAFAKVKLAFKGEGIEPATEKMTDDEAIQVAKDIRMLQYHIIDDVIQDLKDKGRK